MAAQTTTNNANAIPEAAQKAGEQLISAVKQGQNLTLDAAKALAKVTSSVPTPDLSRIAGVQALPDVQTLTAYSFDLAIELLTAQRDFAVSLASAFAPAKTV